jgi:CBS domain-containing protein
MLRESVEAVIRNKASGELVTVEASATVADAVAVMVERRVGAVLIMTEDRLVGGIFTERDVLVRIVHAGRDPKTTPISMVMTRDVRYVTPGTTIEAALALMHLNRHRHLLVIDGPKVHGLVSIGDWSGGDRARKRRFRRQSATWLRVPGPDDLRMRWAPLARIDAAQVLGISRSLAGRPTHRRNRMPAVQRIHHGIRLHGAAQGARDGPACALQCDRSISRCRCRYSADSELSAFNRASTMSVGLSEPLCECFQPPDQPRSRNLRCHPRRWSALGVWHARARSAPSRDSPGSFARGLARTVIRRRRAASGTLPACRPISEACCRL